MLIPRVITISAGVDSASVINVSISFSKSSGTASFTCKENPYFKVKDKITIQGLQCTIERVTSSLSNSEKVYKVEARILPNFSKEFIALDYPDYPDGTSYKVHQIINDAAAAAGTKVDIFVDDSEVQSFTRRGRFISILEELAGYCGGVLVQQNGNWYVVKRDFAIGSFTVPYDDIISVSQSTQSDFVDTVSDKINEVIDAGLALKDLADKVAELEEDVAELQEDLDAAVADEADNGADGSGGGSGSIVTGVSDSLIKNQLGEINFLFGWVGKQFKPIDTNIVIDGTQNGQRSAGGEWDYWEPTANSTVNPNFPSRKYFRIDKELDASGEFTGMMRGLYNPVGCTFLYPFQKPENSAGVYFGKGISVNTYGLPTGDSSWQSLTDTERVSKYVDSNGIVHETVSHYFAFSVFPDIEPYYDERLGAWTVKYIPDTHKVYFKGERIKVEYLPKIHTPFKFKGEILFNKWVIKRSGPAVVYGVQGMADVIIAAIDVDGMVYDISGNDITEVNDISEIPGGGVIGGHPVIDSAGNIVGEFRGTEFRNINGEFRGQLAIFTSNSQQIISSDIYEYYTGSYFNSPKAGYIPYPLHNKPEAVVFPGIGGNNPQITDPSTNRTIDKPNLPIFHFKDFPAAAAIDFTDYDPANPGGWQPTLLDPNEKTVQLKTELDNVKESLIETEVDKRITATKLENLKDDLGIYGVEDALPVAQAVIDAEKALSEERQRQEDLNIFNKDGLEVIRTQQLVPASQALANYLSSIDKSAVVTECSFVYNGVLPLPNQALTVPVIADWYEEDAGVIDSVTLNLTSSNCTCTVSATRY